MSFSDLFQKLKHENYKLSNNELTRVIAFLGMPSSISNPESHAAIYVLCLSTKPTEQNLALLERFIAEDADDYARASAIDCIFTIWHVFEERHLTYLRDALGRMLDEERFESSNAAFYAAVHMMHAHNRYDLSVAIDGAVKTLFDAAQLENIADNEEGFATRMLITTCWKLRHVWARKTAQRLTYFDTLAEALEVYRNKEAYLLRPVH